MLLFLAGSLIPTLKWLSSSHLADLVAQAACRITAVLSGLIYSCVARSSTLNPATVRDPGEDRAAASSNTGTDGANTETRPSAKDLLIYMYGFVRRTGAGDIFC